MHSRGIDPGFLYAGVVKWIDTAEFLTAAECAPASRFESWLQHR